MLLKNSNSFRQLGLLILFGAIIFSSSVASAMTGQQEEEAEGLVPPTPRAESGTRAAETLPSDLMDPDEIGWLSLRDASSSAFSDFFQSKKATHMMIDIEVDEVDGEQQVAGIWQVNTDGRGWAEKRNLTSAQFSENWNTYKDQGYRLIDQEAYLLNGNRYYAGIWIENKEGLGWASLRNLTSAQFSEKFAQYSRAGYMIIDVEAYLTKDNELRYSMVWVQNSEDLDWSEYRNMTSAEFSDKFDAFKATHRMIDVEGYKNSSGEMRYAGIWVENKNGRGWAELRNMTENRFRNEWYRRRDLGYRLVDFEKYAYGSGYRYAGIWRQNNDRPDWDQKSAVNNLIQTEITNSDLSGISVAIIQNGEFQYVRGFGQADIDADVWYSSRTISRLASVSKAVAGVLGTHLEQDGQLNLDTLTQAYEPSIPDHHTQTLRQLLSNRGGIGHYEDHGSANAQFNTALAGSQFFINDPLVYPLGTSCKYSTHGYTVFGLGVEGALNESIGDIIEDELAAPFGLGSLQVENRSDGNWQRATLYNDDNAEVTPDNISWKVLGGGLESSVYDLARLGNKVLNGTILNQTSRDAMWSIPAPVNCSNYGLGWNVGTDQGTMVVAKNGAQTGAESYIRMYPEHDIVIAILTNQRGDHNPVQLGRDIGTLLLDNLPAGVQSQGLPFQNFNHLALGDAQLLKDREGNLVVNGFGTSGDDGFVVALDEAKLWRAELDLDFAELASKGKNGGAVLNAINMNGKVESTLDLSQIGNGMGVAPTFHSEKYAVEMTTETGVIKIAEADNGTQTALIDWDELWCTLNLPGGLPSEICRITIEFQQNNDGDCEWTLTFAEAVPATLADGKKVEVRQMRMVEIEHDHGHADGRAPAEEMTFSGMEVFGTALDQIVVYSEEAEKAVAIEEFKVLLPLIGR
ncbi:MAG: serine hydrolase [Anaerolineae bacterium]